MNMECEKVVMMSVVGMSPAVVTESIWALYEERPELVPDEVKVYTTRKGWDSLSRGLLTEHEGMTVWKDLQQKVGKEIALDKHIFLNGEGEDMADIVTSADQDLVADQLLKDIRKYKDPKKGECRLVASIAGGRKSMSALMYAVMSLGAAPDDIITHVLADDQYTTCREFYFPAQEQQDLVVKRGNDELNFKACEVKIDLAEIPFVALSGLIPSRDFSLKDSFSNLVKTARDKVVDIVPESCRIRLSAGSRSLFINGQEVQLSKNEYIVMAVLVLHSIEGILSVSPASASELLNKLADWGKMPAEILLMTKNAKNGTLYDFAQWYTYPKEYNRAKFSLKEKLQQAGFQAVVSDAFGEERFGFRRIKDVKFKA